MRGTTLTAFVHSAAWGTRLRYVIPGLRCALGAELGVPIEDVKVKVRAKPGQGDVHLAVTSLRGQALAVAAA